MGRQGGIVAEAVFFIDNGAVARELSWADFQTLVGRSAADEQLANREVQAIYAEVATGLSVKGMACFTLAFDADGKVDADWNIPVQDLARNAGLGPNLGNGPVRLACRSQCSIPWVTMRLWDPELGTDGNPCMAVQRAVWANALGLPGAESKPSLNRTGRWKVRPSSLRAAADTRAPAAPAAPARVEPPLLKERAEQKVEDAELVESQLKRRLDAAFGDTPTIPVEKLVQHSSARAHELVKQHQQELDRLHQEHMKQLRGYRQEIQRLRAEVERERSRNALLEGFLRGEAKA